MKTSVSSLRAWPVWSCCLALLALPLHADQNLAGNVTVTGGASTGNLSVTGAIDSDGNFTFGTQGSTFGGALLYQDNTTDTFTFSINRTPASWLWQHNAGISAMRLNSLHDLILYQADGTTAGLTFQPASNSLKLGSLATLTGDSSGVLTTSGALTVAGNFTNTSGTLTGGATGLTLNAGGTNQNITLGSSGTGDLVFNTNGVERARIKSSGNVGIGTASPNAKLHLSSGDSSFALFGPNATWNSYLVTGAGGSQVASGRAQAISTNGNLHLDAGTGQNIYIGYYTPSHTFINPVGGNVGIGTTNPTARLDVSGGPVILDYLNIRPEDGVNEGGQMSFLGAGGYGAFQIDNYQGHARIHTLASGKQFQVLGGSIYANGTAPNFFGGNVGIGTTSPQNGLSVVAADNWGVLHLHSSTTNGGVPISFRSADDSDGSSGQWLIGKNMGGSTNDNFGIYNGSGGQMVTVLTSGNVGIGTTNPAARLDVNGDIFVGYNVANTSSILKTFATYHASGNVPSAFTVGIADGSLGGMTINNVRDGSANSQSIAFVTHHGGVSAGTRMTIDKDGNVGIGTTNPKTPLEVQGGVSAFPMTSGTSQPAASLRLGNPQTNGVLDIGVNSGSGAWFQYTHQGDLSQAYPLLLNPNGGNVGIGTTSPTHKLAVNGTIRAKEVIVDTGWADYVFADDYRLAPLAEVESHIKAKKHLPGIPSAAEVAEHGVSMGDMQAKLLSKVEELTLHLIAQEKRMTEQAGRLDQLETENRVLRSHLAQR